MSNQEIFAVLDRFEQSSLRCLKLSKEGFTIELSRADAGGVPPAPANQEAFAAPAPQIPGEYSAVTAPLVGTFYAAPAPDQPPFVSAGERVKKGQTLCLIEAMKMMSEIPAPCDGVIVEVLKPSGELAAFGEPLIHYQPC